MAINILEKSRDFNKVEIYAMTSAPNIESLKNVEDGESLEVNGWLEYEEEKDGNKTNICAIMTNDKKVYGFQSETAKRSLKEIHNIMEGEPYSVIKISGKTKAGRDFVNLILDMEKL